MNRAVQQSESHDARDTLRDIFSGSWRYRRERSVGCMAFALVVLLRKSIVYRDAFTLSNNSSGTRTAHCPENRKQREKEVVINM